MALYCSVTASYSFLFDILAEVRKSHPRIEIKLHTGDPEFAVSRVQAGDEDISIGARPPALRHCLGRRRRLFWRDRRITEEFDRCEVSTAEI